MNVNDVLDDIPWIHDSITVWADAWAAWYEHFLDMQPAPDHFAQSWAKKMVAASLTQLYQHSDQQQIVTLGMEIAHKAAAVRQTIAVCKTTAVCKTDETKLPERKPMLPQKTKQALPEVKQIALF